MANTIKLACLVHKILNTGHSPYPPSSYNITSPQGPRVHLPITFFLFRDTTFHLVLALFTLLCPKCGTPYLFTSTNPKHTLPSDVILRRTTFCQPISPPSGPCNAPWFSSETLALYKSLTYLLTYWFYSKTASTIAAFIVHSKLDYCNSLYYNLPKSQINHHQQIHNCLACTVVKAPNFSHITPIFRSLHWLKFNECIEYKFLSLTNKLLTTSQPD